MTNPAESAPESLGVADTAARLGISRGTVYRRLASGALAGVKRGGRWRVFVASGPRGVAPGAAGGSLAAERLADAVPALLAYVDAAGVYRYANAAHEQWYGQPREQILGRPLRDVAGEDAYALLRPQIEAVLAGKRVAFEQVLPVGMSGARAVAATFVPDQDGDGAVRGFFAQLHDLSERAASLATVSASEERYRDLFENASEALYTLDLSGNLTDLNRAGEQLTGYRREELAGTTIARIIAPEQLALLQGNLVSKIAGEPVTTYELELITKAGERRLVEVSSRLIVQGGQAVGIQGSVRDITEHRRLTDALQQSEARLRLVLERLPVGVWLTDAAGDVLLDNPAGERIWGRRLSGPRGSGAHGRDLSTGGVLAAGDWSLERALGHGEPIEDELIELSLPDGETKMIVSSVVPLRDEAGQVSGAVVVNDDVTALRRLERQLREREERLTLAQRAGGIGTFEWFIEEGRVVWTPEMEALFGLPPGSFEGRYEHWTRRVHPDDLPAAEASLWGAVRGGPPYHAEFRILRPDGGERWMLGSGDLYRDAQGRAQRIVGANIDITTRKRAEAALDRYRLLAEHTADIVLFVRPDGRIVDANAAAVTAYGYDAETLRTLSVFDLREPSLLGDVPDQLVAANEIGTRFETVHRRKDGSSLPVEVSTLGAQVGSERLILSVIRDISERKAAELALAASRDELAAVLATVAHGIIVQAPGGRLLYGNTAAARLLGFTSSAGLQATALDALLAPYTILDEAGTPVPPDRLPGHIAMRTGEPAEATLRYRVSPTGEERWSRVRAVPALAADGRVQFVVTAIEEITHLKRAEERQRFLAELARALVAAGADLRGVLEATTRRIAVFMGDCCGIRLLAADGASLEPIGFTHNDPASAACLEELLAAPHRIDEGLAGQVFRSGEAFFMPTVDQVQLAVLLKPEHRPLLDRVAVHSLIMVPLGTASGVAGTLAVARTTPGRAYTKEDLALVQAIADTVALANDNARLVQETRNQLEIHVSLNAALRESAAARDAALREVQEALRIRDEFLASVSHDLRTPLATLKGLAQLLHRRAARGPTVESEAVTRQTTTMELAAARMTRLVDDLLDLARLESGRVLDLTLEPLDLVALTRRVALEHQRAAPYHRITMETTSEALNGVWDGGRLERVLTNLIGNAVKYSPRDGAIAVRLTSDTDAAGRWAVLSVADSGMGIPADELPHVFERFYRARNAAGVIKGTGVGLATVRQIVEQHGGSIAIASAEGAGTTVTVRLPLDAAAAGAVPPRPGGAMRSQS